MARVLFGRAHWGDLPQQLGLTIGRNGVMGGLWRGTLPVFAELMSMHTASPAFARRGSRPPQPFTSMRAVLDPPLGVHGVDHDYYFDRIVHPAFRAEVQARAKTCNIVNVRITDDAIAGACFRYESSPAVYTAIFDLFAWAAQVLQERRTQNPPPWELAIAQTWPSLAQDWGMQLDVRRGKLEGTVRGRPMCARVVNSNGVMMTSVEVAAPLPPGFRLSLSRQLEDAGVFDSLFASLVGGGDITVGDPGFDSAFVVKGEPEAFVRQLLTPAAREQLLGLSRAGASITFETGRLTIWLKRFLLARDELDALMKAAYAAASALGAPAMPSTPPPPYR